MFERKSDRPDHVIVLPRNAKRLGRLPTPALVETIEADLSRCAEALRGFSHTEIDNGWVLAEVESQLLEALAAVNALKEREL